MPLVTRPPAIATLGLAALLALGACTDASSVTTVPELSRRANGLGDDPVTVNQPIIRIEFGAYIPKSKGAVVFWTPPPGQPFASLGWLREPTLPDSVGIPYPLGPLSFFASDNRDGPGENPENGTSRLYSVGEITVKEIGSLRFRRGDFFSVQSDLSYKAKGLWADYDFEPARFALDGNSIVSAEATKSGTSTHSDVAVNVSKASIVAWGEHPFSQLGFPIPVNPAPAIDYDLEVHFIRHDNGDVHVEFAGTHDKFPSYELILLRNKICYSYRAPDPGPDLYNLNTKHSFKSVHGQCVIKASELTGQTGGGTSPVSPAP